MNNKQKVFTIGYIALIIFGVSGLFSAVTGLNYLILILAIGAAIGVFAVVLGIVFLGAWIYGWLEGKPEKC